MFPNFTSLSQRERKRQALLQQIQHDLQVDEAKRLAYSEAMWTEDVLKNAISLAAAKTTLGTQTTTSTSTAPGSPTAPSSPGAPGAPSAPPFPLPPPSPSPAPAPDVPPAAPTESRSLGLGDAFADFNDREVDIDDVDVDADPPYSPGAARDYIKYLYDALPTLVTLKIHPFGFPTKGHVHGSQKTTMFLGPGAELRNTRSGRKINLSLNKIDWVKTMEYVLSKTNVAEWMGRRRQDTSLSAMRDAFNEMRVRRDVEMPQAPPAPAPAAPAPVPPASTPPTRRPIILTEEELMEEKFPVPVTPVSAPRLASPPAIIRTADARTATLIPPSPVEEAPVQPEVLTPSRASSAIRDELEMESFRTLSLLFQVNPAAMRRLATVLHPISRTGKLMPRFLFAFSGGKVVVVKVETGKENPSQYANISWANTLQYVIEKAAALGIELDAATSVKRVADGSPQVSPDVRTRKGVRRAPLTPIKVEDTPPSAATPPPSPPLSPDSSWLDANPLIRQIQTILIRNPWIEDSPTYRFGPVLTTPRRTDKPAGVYFVTEHTTNGRQLWLYDKTSLSRVDQASGMSLLAITNWEKTFDALIDHLLKIIRTTTDLNIQDRIQRVFEFVEYRYSNDQMFSAADYRMLARKKQTAPPLSSADTSLGGKKTKKTPKPYSFVTGSGLQTSSKIQLRARGLVGAGTLNLKTIEGSGSASDQKYKRLGSKFIRLKDLHENKLKLVYPNRTQVGRIREITSGLSQLINKLLFENDIDQQLYDTLAIADKRLFHEILRATHLQHQFRQPLKDPMEQLQAEFDKLRGQIALGNNNPDLIRELKSLSVDLYSQGILNEDQFKQFMFL